MEGKIYPNGIYYGALVNGKREGKGTIIFNDGSRYTGNWVDDQMQGSGYLFDADGNQLHHAVWYEGKIIYEITDESWEQKPRPSSQHYSNRIALCIGNCVYNRSGCAPLNNCISDAEVLSARLKNLGFDTTVIKDARNYDFARCLRDFAQKAQNKEMALVFYSGHGVSHNGRTYMVPVDEGFYCIDEIINLLDEVGCKIKIAVIDACRSNLDEGTKGLYHTNAQNALVAYATSPNYTASDGHCGTHSPYIRALMEMLDKPRIPLSFFFQEVSALVNGYTNGMQQPFIESSLTNIEFFFNRG